MVLVRQQAKLGEYGTTILDYKDVDSFGSAFEYLGNNLALSIPLHGYLSWQQQPQLLSQVVCL